METCATGNPIWPLTLCTQIFQDRKGVRGEGVVFIKDAHFCAQKAVYLHISGSDECGWILTGA
jgi:hypothetical protein